MVDDYQNADDFAPEAEEIPEEQRYWATRPREELHEELLERISREYSVWDESPFSQMVSRNWAYYYGLFKGAEEFNLLGGAVLRMGPRGERSFMQVNHLRNLLQHLHILTTRDRPAPKSRATNADYESIMDAATVDGVLEEYLVDKKVEMVLSRCAEHAIVLTRGYVTLDWDPTLGPEEDGDVEALQRMHAGDLRYGTPSLFDVIRDSEEREGQAPSKWYAIRDWPNKYDLAAVYPKEREKILNSKEPEDTLYYSTRNRHESDRVGRWTFWHDRTPALPTGRRFCFTRDCVLSDHKLPDYLDRAPVYELVPSDILLTSEGWSPGFELQGPQEAYNATISNILTCHDAFGIQNIFSPTGNNLSMGQVSGGLRLIQGKTEPKPLQLTATAKDAYTFLETLQKVMEILSGINSVTRGQPEYTLKSGKALSIVEAKAVQFANRLIAGYMRLLEDVCTCTVRILSAKMRGSRRVSQMAGKTNLVLRNDYSPETLQSVDRVRVEAGNPLLRTLSGRIDLGEMFVKMGWVKTPEELMGLFTHGRLEPMMQADNAMLALLAAEKDALMKGDPAPVLKTDYHALHIREIVALLNTPAIRKDDILAAHVLGHVLTHTAMLYLPDVRDLQLAQGYFVPPVSPMIPPGMLEQIDESGYGESFNEIDRVFLQTPMTQAPVGPAALPQGGAPGPSAGGKPPGGPPSPPESEPSPLETESQVA